MRRSGLMSNRIDDLMTQMDVTRKGAKRISEIVQAGVAILLEEGFMSLTKRKIATRLGISHGNVSYYFPTRESLWQAVIDYELKEYYQRHYTEFHSDANDAEGRFNEFIVRWIDEYRDREMRIFFAQVLAFAEVNTVVAKLRDDIYEMFYQETLTRVAALQPAVSEVRLRPRVLSIIAMLEGLHAVTAFRPELLKGEDTFRNALVQQVKAIARGSRNGS